MTIRGLVLRFTVAYLVSLICGFLLFVYFRSSSTLVIMTAGLAASTLYVCQLFCRRNGRTFSKLETLQAWAAFLAIDIVLQLLTVVSWGGTVQESLARVKQFAAGGLIFTALFHGICIYAFIVLAERVAVRKSGS